MEAYQKVLKKKEDTAENEIRVKVAGQLSSYMSYAFRILNKTEHTSLTIRATGKAINKAVILIERIKRRIGDLHQINHVHSTTIIDVYQPKIEDLDVIEQKRSVPAIDCTLSKEPLDTSDIGYQPPEPKEERPPQPPSRPPREAPPREERGGRRGGRGRGDHPHPRGDRDHPRGDREHPRGDRDHPRGDRDHPRGKPSTRGRDDRVQEPPQTEYRGRGGQRGERGGRARGGERGRVRRYNDDFNVSSKPRFNDEEPQTRHSQQKHSTHPPAQETHQRETHTRGGHHQGPPPTRAQHGEPRAPPREFKHHERPPQNDRPPQQHHERAYRGHEPPRGPPPQRDVFPHSKPEIIEPVMNRGGRGGRGMRGAPPRGGSRFNDDFNLPPRPPRYEDDAFAPNPTMHRGGYRPEQHYHRPEPSYYEPHQQRDHDYPPQNYGPPMRGGRGGGPSYHQQHDRYFNEAGGEPHYGEQGSYPPPGRQQYREPARYDDRSHPHHERDHLQDDDHYQPPAIMHGGSRGDHPQGIRRPTMRGRGDFRMRGSGRGDIRMRGGGRGTFRGADRGGRPEDMHPNWDDQMR